jgi:hypothetical protein
MKKIWLIGALIMGLGFGVGSANAQDDKSAKTKTEKSSTKEKTDAERKADKADKSKAGAAIDDAGGTAKKGGKKVEEGASWTWDKTKHNKATKNTFNQPGDE